MPRFPPTFDSTGFSSKLLSMLFYTVKYQQHHRTASSFYAMWRSFCALRSDPGNDYPYVKRDTRGQHRKNTRAPSPPGFRKKLEESSMWSNMEPSTTPSTIHHRKCGDYRWSKNAGSYFSLFDTVARIPYDVVFVAAIAAAPIQMSGRLSPPA